MKQRVGSSGFTIAETMIVLAVTGILFAVIAGSLSGRQRNNEFIQAVNDARDKIQQIIAQTGQGYYERRSNFKCERSGSLVVLTAPGSSPEQGGNNDCVFLGTLLQFNEGGSNPSRVRVYPVTGLRTANTLATADPSVVRNGFIDASSTFKLKYGLSLASMRANGTNIASFGVVSSVDSTTLGESGDQLFDVYAITTVAPNSPPITDVTGLGLTAVTKNPAGGIKICLASAGTNQSGLITVGNNGSRLSVDLEVKGNITCT